LNFSVKKDSFQLITASASYPIPAKLYLLVECKFKSAETGTLVDIKIKPTLPLDTSERIFFAAFHILILFVGIVLFISANQTPIDEAIIRRGFLPIVYFLIAFMIAPLYQVSQREIPKIIRKSLLDN
jgi:hypothetical protein